MKADAIATRMSVLGRALPRGPARRRRSARGRADGRSAGGRRFRRRARGNGEEASWRSSSSSGIRWSSPIGRCRSWMASRSPRRCAAAAASTYIIMLTMREASVDYERGYVAGVDDYLDKSVPDAELFARITAAFNTLALRRSWRSAGGSRTGCGDRPGIRRVLAPRAVQSIDGRNQADPGAALRSFARRTDDRCESNRYCDAPRARKAARARRCPQAYRARTGRLGGQSGGLACGRFRRRVA